MAGSGEGLLDRIWRELQSGFCSIIWAVVLNHSYDFSFSGRLHRALLHGK